jgi:hypothetical protein
MAYVKEKGLKIKPPSREVYLKGPRNDFQGKPGILLAAVSNQGECPRERIPRSLLRGLSIYL